MEFEPSHTWKEFKVRSKEAHLAFGLCKLTLQWNGWVFIRSNIFYIEKYYQNTF
jgi:hypothetical protein